MGWNASSFEVRTLLYAGFINMTALGCAAELGEERIAGEELDLTINATAEPTFLDPNATWAHLIPPASSHIASFSQPVAPLFSIPNQRGRNNLEQYGALGSDLGANFEYQGQTVFMFGDTWPNRAGVSHDNPFNADSIGLSSASGVTRFSSPPLSLLQTSSQRGQPTFSAAEVEGISQDGMEVPVEGFAVGSTIYAFFVTGWNDGRYSHSVLAKRGNLASATFEEVYVHRTERFLNVSLVRENGYLYLFGASNPYREGRIYLARVRESAVERRSEYRYFAGRRSDGSDIWRRYESQAIPIGHETCYGEFNVRYIDALDQYLMLSTCGDDGRGVYLKTSDAITGPWSQPERIWSHSDGGYGVTIHQNEERVGYDDGLNQLDHPLRRGEEIWGGEYAPYIVPRWSRSADVNIGGLPRPGFELVWVMSTWVPYRVYIYRTMLTPRDAPRRGLVLFGPRDTNLVNADFSDGLRGWQVVGGPFSRFTRGGRRHVSTYHRDGGDQLQGSLSQEVQIGTNAKSLEFTVHGGHARVYLEVAGTIYRETIGRDDNSHDLRVRWDLTELRRQTARLVIDDSLSERWGFISVSEFHVDSSP